MESIENLIRLYHHLARDISEKQSRTARLIRSGNWQFAEKRLMEEMKEALQAFYGRHENPPDKNPLLAELAAEKGIDQRLSDIVLEASQLSYWYLVFHLAKETLTEKIAPEKKQALDAQSVVSALREGARSAAALTDHERRIREDTTVETVYGFIGKMLARAELPLDIFAELDLREMGQKPYLADLIQRKQKGTRR